MFSFCKFLQTKLILVFYPCHTPTKLQEKFEKSYSSHQNWILWIRLHLFNYYVWVLFANFVFWRRQCKNKVPCDPLSQLIQFYNTSYSVTYNNVIFPLLTLEESFQEEFSFQVLFAFVLGVKPVSGCWSRLTGTQRNGNYWHLIAGPGVVPSVHLRCWADLFHPQRSDVSMEITSLSYGDAM